MKQETQSLPSLEEVSQGPTGLDLLIEEMLELGIPVSLENYLKLNGLPWEEMDAELRASVPRVLVDPRLKELDPSDTRYESLLDLIARPEFKNHTVDEMVAELKAIGA